MDNIYISFIQNSINNYLKNGITYDFVKDIKYFAKCRNMIAKIMDEIEEKTNNNKFCKKEDVIYFGMFRTDIIITPLSGRYQQSFLELCKNSCKEENNIFSKDIIENENVYTKIRYNFKESNKESIDVYDFLSEKCIIHTNPSNFNIIIKEISNLYSKYLNYKEDNGLDVVYFIKIIWLLSQATFFKRGSASITEMIMLYLANVKEKHNVSSIDNDIKKICNIKGIDLIALYNNYDEFEKIIKNNINSIAYSNTLIIKQENTLNIHDLDDFYYIILKSSKKDVKKYLLQDFIDIYISYNNLKNNLYNKSKEITSSGYISFVSELKNLFEDI
jgi:hypothetical protein